MTRSATTLAVLLLAGCATGAPRQEPDSPRLPSDTTVTFDTVGTPVPDTAPATPPIIPEPEQDTADMQDTAAVQDTAGQDTAGAQEQAAFTEVEYQGWRQYSVQCARCHGQDVLGNPVAPDLLRSVGEGGAYAELEPFVQIVQKGRLGMPAFEDILTREQIEAIHAYVRGRALERLPAGRPEAPGG